MKRQLLHAKHKHLLWRDWVRMCILFITLLHTDHLFTVILNEERYVADKLFYLSKKSWACLNWCNMSSLSLLNKFSISSLSHHWAVTCCLLLPLHSKGTQPASWDLPWHLPAKLSCTSLPEGVSGLLVGNQAVEDEPLGESWCRQRNCNQGLQ